MKIDFLHNKIFASTVTEKWKESFTEGVLPKLQKKYGGDIEGVQAYEDHIADGFTVGKTFYYPLSVATISAGAVTEWLSWEMKKGAFEDDVPFAYVGEELLEIGLPTEVPTAFVEKLGEAKYFDEKTVKLRVETTATDITILSGRYSQSFIDEMARQLTPLISSAMSVMGIEDSSVELAIVFAPDTYMEHTSESVTYRRLLLVDKSSAPRDFWIKWTRLDGNGAYTVSDDVTGEDILFEIGEDVSKKIMEKEYRFLTRAGKDKYHNAMGRKNITGWRDVIKRAVRKGELEKLPEPVAEEPAAVAEVPTEEPAAPIRAVSEDDELLLAMEMAQRAIDSVKDGEAPVEEEEEEEELDELEQFYKEDDAPEKPGRGSIDEDEALELEELTRMAMEALRMAKADAEEPEVEELDELEEEETPEDEPSLITFDDGDGEPAGEATVIVPEDPIAEEYEGFEEIDDEEALEDEETLADVRALEPDEEPAVEEPAEAPAAAKAESGISAADLEAKIRSELEAKIRLEYESEARRRAEEEAERLRREQEQLRRENERLADRARREKEERAKAEEARVAETEKLRAQIEAQVRQEAKERERIAEAARQAVEERNRLEAERLQNERMKLEAERRAEEERRRREEEARIEAEKQREAERLRRAEEERLAKERAAKVDEKGYVDNNYTYVSKTVRLIFRRAVDPNVTARIHEILKATLEYYGKQKVYMRIKATVPNSTTVCLEFVQFPLEEMELLGNIIKVIGNSGLGIMKAILE